MINLEVTCDGRSHVPLFDITNLCPSVIYNEKNLRLSAHLKRPFEKHI